MLVSSYSLVTTWPMCIPGTSWPGAFSVELGQWVANLPPHPAEVLPTLQVQGQNPVVQCRFYRYLLCFQ